MHESRAMDLAYSITAKARKNIFQPHVSYLLGLSPLSVKGDGRYLYRQKLVRNFILDD
jgi:hypothetical protein